MLLKNTTRSNPQIWNMARFLSKELTGRSWNQTKLQVRQKYYDTVKKFLYAAAYNAFTGTDNHVD